MLVSEGLGLCDLPKALVTFGAVAFAVFPFVLCFREATEFLSTFPWPPRLLPK